MQIHTNNTGGQFFLIAGPCVVEGEEIVMRIAERLRRLCEGYAIPFVFKASFTKANRTRLDSFTGIGDRKALEILKKAGERYSVPVTTDIHNAGQAAMAADYADILQIPAFLCRQTELLLAAGETGRTINIKKGQFMSPEAMGFAAEKIRSTGNDKVMLTERGTTFGYSDLVVDFRSVPIMQSLGCPVVVDCTHSLQRPNQHKGVTGGDPQFIGTIARAAIAAGADGLFIETHPSPAEALSDGANMLQIDLLEPLLDILVRIREAITSEVRTDPSA